MHFDTRTKILVPLLTLVLFLALSHHASSLTIIRDYFGGSPAINAVGGGNLVDIFNAAADYWELAILDSHVITLHYGWAPITGSSANHYLQVQSGMPSRETEGTINFNNDGSSPIEWFLDPTPYSHEEFQMYQENIQDMGGGPMNTARYFSNPRGLAVDRIDLLMEAMHEIGHSLGMSLGNTSWIQESGDHDIDITLPRPFAGSIFPLATNLFGLTSHFSLDAFGYGTLMSGGNGGERRIPAGADILANAQISQFTRLNIDLAPVLKAMHTGTNIVLSWSAHATDFELQQNPSIVQSHSHPTSP